MNNYIVGTQEMRRHPIVSLTCSQRLASTLTTMMCCHCLLLSIQSIGRLLTTCITIGTCTISRAHKERIVHCLNHPLYICHIMHLLHSTNHRANRVAVLTVVTAHILVTIVKVQGVSVTTTIRRRTPIFTVIAYRVLATIVPVASSRNE